VPASDWIDTGWEGEQYMLGATFRAVDCSGAGSLVVVEKGL